ncbi:hypothetical protein D3C84_725270 [compost metagenome]
MSQTQFAAQGIHRNRISHLPRLKARLLQRCRFGAGLAHQLDAPRGALDIRARRQRYFDHAVAQRFRGFAGDDHFVQIQAVAGQRLGAHRFQFEGEGFITRHQTRQATGDGHRHRINRRLFSLETQRGT